MKRRILLGLTGSVATVLWKKLVTQLSEHFIVDTIITNSARHFIDCLELALLVEKLGGIYYVDDDEWQWQDPTTGRITSKWKTGDGVLHINIRNQASALVIAPCSLNTMGKIANGLCDNLLTSVVRAWDMNRPLIIAGAANTAMWEHPVTKEHLDKLTNWGYKIVMPQSKMLACKTEGMGALADISDIVKEVNNSLKWHFPLHWRFDDSKNTNCSGIPIKGHPGAFLTKRKHHTHTGVDLYTNDGASVYAVESGTVVGIEEFTGSSQQTPWWNDTKCVLVEGASGVVCYGEIDIDFGMKIGKKLKSGDFIGNVKRVLKEGKERPDIQGHNTSMLHIELYKHGIYRAFEEVGDNKSDWNDLIDPTPIFN